MLNHIGGTISHGCVMGYPRISIGMESWKNPADLQITMNWIKEVDIAKSIDELVTSRLITRQHNFPDFDMPDAMIASVLVKLLNTQSNPKKEQVSKSSEFGRTTDSYEEDELHT